MFLYAARKIGTEDFLNKTGLGLCSESGSAKLNTFNAINKKLDSYLEYTGRRTGEMKSDFEIVTYELVINNIERC